MSQVPVINVAPLIQDDKLEYSKIGELFYQCFHETGFAYIEGHGIEDTLISEIFTHAKSFFKRPLQEKMAIDMKKSQLAWRGYFPLEGELTSGKPDQKEGIYFGVDHLPSHPGVQQNWPLHGTNLWLAEDLAFKSSVDGYMRQLNRLGATLMKGFAISLGLSEDYFSKRFQSPTNLFRIFNYPIHKWNPQEDEWGVREHTDMGFLTILKQDASGGLEAKQRNNQWIEIPPIEGTFVINIGDMLELWTHGIYRATPHRVRNKGCDGRLSLPFFYDPNWEATLEAIDPKLIKRKIGPSPSKSRWDNLDIKALKGTMTYGDFVWNKVKNVFPELAKED